MSRSTKSRNKENNAVPPKKNIEAKLELLEQRLERLVLAMESVTGATTIKPTPTDEVLGAILRERTRQKEVELWTSKHDDEHCHGELAEAACYYAWPEQAKPSGDGSDLLTKEAPTLRRLWPISWDDDYAKKSAKTRRQQLIVAGALIVAEIERLDRQGSKD
jgi:hypothetical protein